MRTQRPWHMCVAIPARNEEKLLARCLRSVALARKTVESAVTVDVVVISDSSTDRTLSIASRILGRNGMVGSISAGAVGVARQTAVRLALERYHGPLGRCWIANTDADCIVPAEWLLQQVKLADQGIEAIAGTVSVDTFEEHQPWVPSRFEDSYIIRSDSMHGHVHGANLGVRADWYVRAGGWANLETAEDHDLWKRLSLVGARKSSTALIEVATSGRRVGRAPNGFAAALASHN